MSYVLGQIAFLIAAFAATVGPCWLLHLHGQRTGRVWETRILAGIVLTVASCAVGAVLGTWPVTP